MRNRRDIARKKKKREKEKEREKMIGCRAILLGNRI
jgi:hypothetical protein